MKTDIFRIVTVLSLLLLFTSLAQAKYFDILEFRELGSDFTADREFVQDMDQRVCAALRLDPATPINVTLREKVYREATIGGNKYLFFSISEPHLTLEAPGFDPKELRPPDHTEFITGKVYYLRFRPMDKIPLRINVEPRDAEIVVDGNVWRQGRVQPGEYSVVITKDGYEPVADVISVSENSREFSYRLVSGEVEVSVVVNPSDADVQVNGISWAEPTGLLVPGAYPIRITRTGYKDIAETIEVTSDDRLFVYEMEEILVNLTIEVNPPDAVILINEEMWMDHTGMIPAGYHTLNISKDGYLPVEETIFAEGRSLTLSYSLDAIPREPEPAAKPPETETVAEPGSLPSATRFNFTFNMLSCSFVDDNVEVVFQIINNDEEDRDLTFNLRQEVKFYDDQGREWGNVSSEFANSTARRGAWNIANKMINNVPTRLVLRFENVHPTAKTMTLLQIGTNFGEIQFRNVPISK